MVILKGTTACAIPKSVHCSYDTNFKKSNIVPVQSMKAYIERRGIAPLILNPGTK